MGKDGLEKPSVQNSESNETPNPQESTINGAIASGLDALEKFGLSRELIFKSMDTLMGDEDSIIASLIRPFYNPERAKLLKPHLNKVLGEGKWTLSDDAIITIFQAQKKNEEFKNRSFEEWIKHLKINGESDNGTWTLKALDISGKMGDEKLKTLQEKVNKSILIKNASPEDLLKGAVTGIYKSEKIEAAKQAAIAGFDNISEEQQKALKKHAIGKDVIKAVCTHAFTLKFPAIGENIEISGDESMQKITGIKKMGKFPVQEISRSGYEWKITIARLTLPVDIEQLDTLLKDLSSLNTKSDVKGKNLSKYFPGANESELSSLELELRKLLPADTPQAPKTETPSDTTAFKPAPEGSPKPPETT